MTTWNPIDFPQCLQTPHRYTAQSWQEHIPFAMALIEMTAPRLLVELGVHTGDSYLAFCQAVAALNLPTACFGVDTWRGDPHAGFFGDEVLKDLREHHDPLYGAFSRLMQQTFDEAAAYFAEGTIDLLHIDGFHTYEAVGHDYALWRDKLSSRGVVIFHDINVRERDFGVFRLWQDLSAQHPHFAFRHGHGLGLLCVGSEIPERLRPLVALPPAEAAKVGELFFLLGNRLTAHAEVQRLRAEAAGRQRHVEELGAHARALEAQVAAQAAAHQREQGLARLRSEAQDAELLRLRALVDQLEASVSFRLGMAATAPLRWAKTRMG